MNSRKTLFAILGGVALTTVAGILLSSYRNSSGRKNAVENGDYTDIVEEIVEDTVANAKKELKKIGEDADRMINEGGNSV